MNNYLWHTQARETDTGRYYEYA